MSPLSALSDRLITTVSLMLGIAYITRKNLDLAPAGTRTDWPQRWRALKDIWGSMLLMAIVLGGIYGASVGSAIGAVPGAAEIIELAAGALALICAMPGARYGFFFGMVGS